MVILSNQGPHLIVFISDVYDNMELASWEESLRETIFLLFSPLAILLGVEHNLPCNSHQIFYRNWYVWTKAMRWMIDHDVQRQSILNLTCKDNV